MRRTLAIAAAATLAGMWSVAFTAPIAQAGSHDTAASSASDATRIRALKRQISTLRHSREHWVTKYEELNVDYGQLDQKFSDLAEDYRTAQGQITTLTGQVSTLTSQASGAAPGAIAQVPAVQFFTQVLAPARDRWRALGGCVSYYTSGTYWSLDFSPSGLC